MQRALELEADALLVAKRGVDAVYDKDPRAHADARRFSELSYADAVSLGIGVMDTNAFVLANEHALTMHVFDVAAQDAMRSIVAGENIGTIVTR